MPAPVVSPIFGPIRTAAVAEQAVTATLQRWMPTYVAELERQNGLAAGSIPAVRGWTLTNQFDQSQSDQTPTIIVISPGSEGTPVRSGEGAITVVWRVEVAVIANGRDRASSNLFAKVYAAAIRAIVVQQPSLGGVAAASVYAGESFTDAPADYLPVGAVAVVEFAVTVTEAVNRKLGPLDPDSTDTDWPEVETVNVEVQRSNT